MDNTNPTTEANNTSVDTANTTNTNNSATNSSTTNSSSTPEMSLHTPPANGTDSSSSSNSSDTSTDASNSSSDKKSHTSHSTSPIQKLFTKLPKPVLGLVALVLVVAIGTGGFFAYQKYTNKNATHAATAAYLASSCSSTASTYTSCLDHSAEAQMTRLYLGLFNRQPDAPGLSYWSNAMVTGKSLYSIAAYFAASKEFQTRYPNASNTTYVTALYQNVLGRAPDAGGLNYWVNLLNANKTNRAQVLLNFTESPENVSSIGTDVRCFVANSTCTSGLLIATQTSEGKLVVITSKKHLVVEFNNPNTSTILGWGPRNTNTVVATTPLNNYTALGIEYRRINSIQTQTSLVGTKTTTSTEFNIDPDTSTIFWSNNQKSIDALKLNGSNKTTPLFSFTPPNTNGCNVLQTTAISPDRRYVVVGTGSDYYAYCPMYIINTTNGTSKTLQDIAASSPENYYCDGLALSMDDSRLAATCGDYLCVMNIDGTDSWCSGKLLADNPSLTPNTLRVKWSPDDKQIIVMGPASPSTSQSYTPTLNNVYMKLFNVSSNNVVDVKNPILDKSILTPASSYAAGYTARLVDWR